MINERLGDREGRKEKKTVRKRKGWEGETAKGREEGGGKIEGKKQETKTLSGIHGLHLSLFHMKICTALNQIRKVMQETILIPKQ